MVTRYFGLNERGKNIVKNHIKKEVYDHYDGQPLFSYTLPGELVLREELQCELWQKGPCYFLALKDDLIDIWIEASIWPAHHLMDLNEELLWN